jgi:NitT/TauT family transport system permease protein
MRIAVRYAFTTTLLAELIAANRGLGFLIELNSGNFNTTGAYAAIVVIIICSVLLTELLSLLESRMSHWSGRFHGR